MRVLLVEDEAKLAASVAEFLREESVTCDIAPTYADAEEKVDLFEYDCILLDLTLPDGNGLDLLRYLKSSRNSAGILIISARNSADQRIAGLDLGADDYLPKPFHLGELNARVKAIFRRKHFNGQPVVQLGKLRIDTQQHETFIENTTVHLTRSEYQLLLYLAANQGRVISRMSLAEHLIGEDADHLDDFDFIYSHVKNLRRKLSAAGGDDWIKAVYGVGYKFIAS